MLANTSYATKQNDRYKTAIDEYVSISERINEIYDDAPEFQELFTEFAEEFVANWDEFATYEDMCKAMVGMGVKEYLPITEIDVNHTMQRNPDPEWLLDILSKFDPILVNRVRTYQDPFREDGGETRYNAWDGQHTTLTLYIIAVYGYKMDPADVMVPIDVYPGHDRAAIRRQFVYYNSGEGVKQLDKIDMFKQYVYGYTNDNSREFWNERCYEIQQIAERYDMFLTDEKFGDDSYPGAVSRMIEIMNRNFPLECIERAFYYHSLANPTLPVAPLEIDNMSIFFRKAMQQGIDLTDEYVQEIVEVMETVTGNTWKVGSRKHEMVKKAYVNWFKMAKKSGIILSDKTPRCNQTLVGPTWIQQMLKVNGFTEQLPTFDDPWTFDEKDLVV